jgi:hypothetical protein
MRQCEALALAKAQPIGLSKQELVFLADNLFRFRLAKRLNSPQASSGLAAGRLQSGRADVARRSAFRESWEA